MCAEGAPAYKCIYPKCNQTFKSKGSCVRHLLNTHIDPQRRCCKKCNHPFDTLKETRAHCARCSHDDNAFVKRRDERRYYASDFSDACFKHSPDLAKHLTTEYCRLPHRTDIRVDYNRKLRSLLEQDDYKEQIASVSDLVLGYAGTWTTLSWEEDVARSFSVELEKGFLKIPDDQSASATRLSLAETLEALIKASMEHSDLDWAMPFYAENIANGPKSITSNICVPIREVSKAMVEHRSNSEENMAHRNQGRCQHDPHAVPATQGAAGFGAYVGNPMSRHDHVQQHQKSALSGYANTYWYPDSVGEQQAQIYVVPPYALDQANYQPNYSLEQDGAMLERAVSSPAIMMHCSGQRCPALGPCEAAFTPSPEDFWPCWP